MRVSLARSLFLAITTALVQFASPATAQDDTFNEVLSRAVNAIRNGQTEVALQATTDGINRFGGTAQLYGPIFGHLWYIKGTAEGRLRQFDAAAESFKTCYEKFPNVKVVDPNAPPASTNRFHKLAILRWAEALQRDEDYEEALKIFQKFLDERDPDASSDRFDRGLFYINRSICHVKMEPAQFTEGIEQLETALENKVQYRVRNNQIVSAYKAFVESVIRDGGPAEQVLIDFVRKNGHHLDFSPWEAFEFSALYSSLASQAFQKDLFRVASILYAQVPSAEVALADVEALISSFAPMQQVRDGRVTYNLQRLAGIRDKISAQLEAPDSYESIALQATGAIQGKLENDRNAYAVYEQLEALHPRSKNRERSLYFLVIYGAKIQETLEVERYGQRFLRDFPDSEFAPAVRRQMMLSLFNDGEFAKCIEIGELMEPTLEKGSEQHDTCLYVLGGSYYYEAQFIKAQPALDRHVKEYPESKFAQSAQFFQASNVVRLQNWPRAGKLLDAFLAAHPKAEKNPYMATALYDRAEVHYAEDQLDQALEKAKRIEKEFEFAPVAEIALKLQGNIYQGRDDWALAEEYYKKCFDVASRRENNFIAGEALSSLVGLLAAQDGSVGGKDRRLEAVAFYDQFFEDYAEGSSFRAQTAVVGLEPMRLAGRGEEGLERLQSVIISEAQNPDSPTLEPAINSYTEAYLEEHTLDELRQHFYDDFVLPNDSARALLRTALISTWEQELEAAKKEKDEAKTIRANVAIEQLFKDLNAGFEPSTLSNYTLIKLGDFLRTKTQSPQSARKYYEEIVGRDNPAYRFEAFFGLADILGQTGSAADAKQAVAYLDSVIESAETKKQREQAYYRIVQVQRAQENWDQVVKVGYEYLTPDKDGAKTRRGKQSFATYGSRVSLLVAEGYDNQGKFDLAAQTYNSAAFAGSARPSVSVPAYLRWSELLWTGKTGSGDKQKVYNVIAKYVDRMKRNYSRMTPEDLALMKQLEARVAEYENSGQIEALPTEEPAE